jgi:hypothetical protein
MSIRYTSLVANSLLLSRIWHILRVTTPTEASFLIAISRLHGSYTFFHEYTGHVSILPLLVCDSGSRYKYLFKIPTMRSLRMVLS